MSLLKVTTAFCIGGQRAPARAAKIEIAARYRRIASELYHWLLPPWSGAVPRYPAQGERSMALGTLRVKLALSKPKGLARNDEVR